jgi:hypothetical protein
MGIDGILGALHAMHAPPRQGCYEHEGRSRWEAQEMGWDFSLCYDR